MFSNTLKAKSLKTELGKGIIPYKKFKKRYTFDNAGKFKGKPELSEIHLFNDKHFLILKNLILN